jgi:hypothetical protein
MHRTSVVRFLSNHASGGLRRVAASATFATVLALGLPGAPSAGAAITPCTTPPAITPESSLTDGTMGTGWTTVKGRTPVSFDVEVLGILQDGIAPGIDFILVKVSGPVIDATGGIAAGFSGSPVYVNGKLAGAIAYSFYYGDQTIGGMTPAQPMVDLLNYPAPARSSVPMAKSVHLTKRLRAAAAAAAGVSAESFASTAKRIPTPFAASGLAATNQLDLQGLLDKHGMNATAYAAGSAPRPTASSLSTTPLAPGQPFAEVLSYGTITFAGVGMTTLVCGDYAVAFGHAFDLKGGGISNGENAADILTVVSDPSGLVGGFDVAQVAEPIGAIDQDRLAGIRGVQGVMVHTLPITSDIVNLDTGKELVRETDVVARGFWPRYIAYYHVYENLIGALDARSGTVNIHWTITGKANGDQFTLNRDNEYSGGGFYYRAAYELYSEMRSLQNNDFGHAKLTAIDVSATVTAAKDLAAIRRARTGSSLEPLDHHHRLQVQPGDTIQVSVPIAPLDGSPLVHVNLSIPVPNTVTGNGRLEVENGYPRYFTRGDTIQQVVKRLENGPHTYDLMITLKMDGMKALRYQLPQDWVLERNRTNVKIDLVS